ncbi:Ig-like domain-containing protein [Phenylobacterium sp.]|uniref:Ig-like domain-containing protein n=1 Tax=Phenylobacterium sp. TaxID=1871053 RepID=UPI00286E4A50|nr:Ig-like domain-containing protein [Phenylobacterium sp.]
MASFSLRRLRSAFMAASLLCGVAASALHAETTVYNYDALGRLTGAVDSNGRAVAYQYDDAGNRIQVSNGVKAGEIIPLSFASSSTAPGSTSLGAAGMRDVNFGFSNSILVTASEAQPWITADLGVSTYVDHISLAAAIDADHGINEANLNGAVVQTSDDGSTWTSDISISGAIPGAYKDVSPRNNARYIRVKRTIAGQLAAGDFRVFTSSSSSGAPLLDFTLPAKHVEIPYGSVATIEPLAGYDDPSHPGATIRSAQVAAPANVSVLGTSIVYFPPPFFSGTDQITYLVEDANHATATGQITITVLPPAPNALIAMDDVIRGQMDGGGAVNPLLNDSDPDGGQLYVVSHTNPAHGSVVVAGGYLFDYHPTLGYVGSDSFTYTVSNQAGGGAGAKFSTATVHITIHPTNHAPTATNDSGGVNAGATTTVTPLTNDTDADADALVIIASTAPVRGTASINSGGQSINYTAPNAFSGLDTFTYTISDGWGGTSTATVTITVSDPGNRPPTAVNDNVAASQSSTISFDPRANDSDPDGDNLTIASVSVPLHGSAAITTGGLVAYTPTAFYIGPDSFSYTIADGRGASGTAMIAVHVAPNDSPVAVTDAISTASNLPRIFDPRTNDSDPDGDLLTVASVSLPLHGTASRNVDGTVTYAATTGYVGADSFTYVLSDGHGGVATGTVNVTVLPPELLSVMEPANYPNTFSISGLTFSSSSQFAGNVYLNRGIGSGKIYWEVKKVCGIIFTGVTNNISTSRDSGGFNNYNAGVNSWDGITWAGANSATAGVGAGANNDIYGFALDPAARTLRIYRNNVLGATRSLPFGGPYYPHSGVQNWNSPCTAQAQFKYGAGQTAYAPPAGYNHFTPLSQNSAPVASNDSASANAGQPTNIQPLTNDNDADGDFLSLVNVTPPNQGSVTIDGATLVYTSAAGYSGSDVFSYTLTDGRGGTATASVSVTVSPATRIFSISPSVNGKSTWNLDVDGALNLASAGAWTIVPSTTFTAPSKTWGGGGGNASNSQNGGAGGAAVGNVTLTAGVSYTLYVGAGGTSGGEHGLGGGYSGIRATSGAAVLIAGGGGTAGNYGHGGAGGGTAGLAANGGGGTQTGGGNGGGGQFPGGTGSAWTGGTDGYHGQMAGGAGYYGGGGGGADPYTYYGSGGGSGYYDPAKVFSAILSAGTSTSPGAASDTMRGGAGAPAGPGRLILGDPSANLAPVAANDNATTELDTAKTVSPLANDTDSNGDNLSVSSVGVPSHGLASVSSAAAILYTPTAGYSGPDIFSYTISDGRGGSATATVSMTVRAANQAPVAVNDATSTPSNAVLTFDPRLNDSDPDGDALSVSAVGTPAHGTVTIGLGGSNVTYTATAGYLGADGFTYTVSDGRGGTSNATIAVTVTPPLNAWDPSTKAASIVLSNGNVTATHGAGAGDASVRGTQAASSGKMHFEVTIGQRTGQRPGVGIVNASASMNTYVGADSNGIALYPNGTIIASGQQLAAPGITFGPGDVIAVELDVANRLAYFQKAGGTRSTGISFSSVVGSVYPAATITGVSDAVTANFGGSPWLVTPTSGYGSTPNANPVAVPDSVAAVDGVAASLSPLGNDSDPEGDSLTISSVGTPAHGSASITTGSKAVVYTSTAGYTGFDSFTYSISDGRGGVATSTVNLTISSQSFDYLVVAGGGGGGGSWFGSPGGGGGGGVISVTGAILPGAYTITVGAGGAGGANNGFPGSGGNSSIGPGITAIGGGYGGSGYDPGRRTGGTGGSGGGTWGAMSGAGGAGSTGMGNNGGAGYGADSAKGAGGGGGAAAAGSSGSPGASGAGGAGYANSISGASLIYGSGGGGGGNASNGNGPSAASGGTNAGNGTNSGNGGNATANLGGGGGGAGFAAAGGSGGSGVVIIRYLIGTASATGGSVTTVGGYTVHTFTSGGVFSLANTIGLNLNPVAANDSAIAVRNAVTTLSPLLNDSDGNGDPLTISTVGSPAHGSAVIASGLTTITYTPAAGYVGADSFSYSISDGRGGSSAATANVTVATDQRNFFISPAVNGHTSWDLDDDGPLSLGTAGTWTITPTRTFTVPTKAWGAGGGGTLGGAGGYAEGAITFSAGQSYSLYVAAPGVVHPNGPVGGGGAPGGGNVQASTAGTGGGGYSGIRQAGGTAILIAGGGGGEAAGYPNRAGAGGGSSGAAGAGGAWYANPGQGGTATAGGSAGTGAYSTGGPGSAFQGGYGNNSGAGGGGYYGGGGGGSGDDGVDGLLSPGGGGSGYYNPAYVSSGVLTAGSGANPGNSSDTARQGAGAPATAGRVRFQ